MRDSKLFSVLIALSINIACKSTATNNEAKLKCVGDDPGAKCTDLDIVQADQQFSILAIEYDYGADQVKIFASHTAKMKLNFQWSVLESFIPEYNITPEIEYRNQNELDNLEHENPEARILTEYALKLEGASGDFLIKLATEKTIHKAIVNSAEETKFSKINALQMPSKSDDPAGNPANDLRYYMCHGIEGLIGKSTNHRFLENGPNSTELLMKLGKSTELRNVIYALSRKDEGDALPTTQLHGKYECYPNDGFRSQVQSSFILSRQSSVLLMKTLMSTYPDPIKNKDSFYYRTNCEPEAANALEGRILPWNTVFPKDITLHCNQSLEYKGHRKEDQNRPRIVCALNQFNDGRISSSCSFSADGGAG